MTTRNESMRSWTKSSQHNSCISGNRSISLQVFKICFHYEFCFFAQIFASEIVLQSVSKYFWGEDKKWHGKSGSILQAQQQFNWVIRLFLRQSSSGNITMQNFSNLFSFAIDKQHSSACALHPWTVKIDINPIFCLHLILH